MIEIKNKLHMFSYCPSGRLNLDSKLKAQEKFHAEKTKEYGELFLNKKLKSSYILSENHMVKEVFDLDIGAFLSSQKAGFKVIHG